MPANGWLGKGRGEAETGQRGEDRKWRGTDDYIIHANALSNCCGSLN